MSHFSSSAYSPPPRLDCSPPPPRHLAVTPVEGTRTGGWAKTLEKTSIIMKPPHPLLLGLWRQPPCHSWERLAWTTFHSPESNFQDLLLGLPLEKANSCGHPSQHFIINIGTIRMHVSLLVFSNISNVSWLNTISWPSIIQIFIIYITQLLLIDHHDHQLYTYL